MTKKAWRSALLPRCGSEALNGGECGIQAPRYGGWAMNEAIWGTKIDTSAVCGMQDTDRRKWLLLLERASRVRCHSC